MLINRDITDSFSAILNSFNSVEDPVGDICCEDATLIAIGRVLFDKEKSEVDKTDEVKKIVKNTMRTLWRLFLNFQESKGGNMN